MASTNYTTFIALYSEIRGYFLVLPFRGGKKMQFAGLNHVFITAIMYTREGGIGKNCAQCLQYKTRVVLKTSGTVFLL